MQNIDTVLYSDSAVAMVSKENETKLDLLCLAYASGYLQIQNNLRL